MSCRPRPLAKSSSLPEAEISEFALSGVSPLAKLLFFQASRRAAKEAPHGSREGFSPDKRATMRGC
jgi:hypothetical protein